MSRIQNSSATNRWRWAGVDASLWLVATLFAVFLRFDFDIAKAFAAPTLVAALSVAALHVALGSLSGPYAVGHSRGSFEEILDLAKTAGVVGLVGLVANALIPVQLVPRSIPITAALISLVAMLAIRMVLRTHRARSTRGEEGERVIILGAGEGGRQLVRTLLRDPSAGLQPVAFVDDDPYKARLSIDGIRVRGTLRDIERLADQTNATTVAVAIPSAGPTLLADVREVAKAAGLTVLVLPPVSELFRGPTGHDLRELDLADLLGRRPVELDAAAIASTINGKVVLVTGAGGSIGSELCRQISMFGPQQLLMLDRDESALHGTQMSLTGQGLLDGEDTLLADIRDPARLDEIFLEHRPQVVFHAAALKHLPLLERYPMEAWKTNVIGTLNVLEAASAHGVETFVNVSTDKAANPTSVLGYSKRLTERLTADFATRSDASTYVSVRFGNVLGSRGSVVTAFTHQIETGGPVTVTHPEVERYFMLIPEACQLVLQSAAIGKDGQVMVLDMGTPAKINAVATTLIEMSGKDIDIVYTGLRPGEKMSEELFSPVEDREPTAHPLVSSVGVPALNKQHVRFVRHGSPDAAGGWMRDMSKISLEIHTAEAR